ncbi:proline racemase family protein [Microbacterium sp. SA39]|uniref:proline racemase family protein n=1 Tax=Microbacterium sp. SA39 TaxID=1263625 RepID=UPI0005F9B0C6|nr:proline racemase family protein [Microbacterium sp. SA39]KJQ55806.1 Proline racemase [Microbacterium sp. SA39]
MSEILTLDTVEVHAEGEPGRVVLNAAGLVRGETMAERLAYCRENLDGLRRMLLHEPRGYPGLCAVFVLPAVNPGSDFGIVVLEQGGFTPMSGSNTMCTVTAILETGMLPMREPTTEVTIDTAVGVVRAIAHVSGSKVTAVTVVNVPAFVVDLDMPLDIPGVGTVPADIVFGGQFFAQVKASDCGVDLVPGNGRDLARMGALIKLAARRQTVVAHPLNPEINRIDLVMIHTGDRLNGREDRNTVVLTNGELRDDAPATWTGALDRSPCGTGTSARMAALHARGQLAIGEDFSHRSIIGTEFVGRLTGETDVAGVRAVLPTVTGRAWITGRAQWTLDETDPFPHGYTVGDIWSPDAS